MTLPSTVTRDPGYQQGYVQDYNSASLCANRKTGPGGTITLGPTALGGGEAYVSESPPDPEQDQEAPQPPRPGRAPPDSSADDDPHYRY